MDKVTATKWFPVIASIVEAAVVRNLSIDEATDSILMLLEPPGTTRSPPPAPVQQTRAPRRRKREATPPPTPAPTPTAGASPNHQAAKADAPKEMSPEAYYTVEEAAAYAGVAKPTIYGILQNDPEKLPFQRKGVEYMIRGKGIMMYKAERDKRAQSNGENAQRE